MAKFIKVNSCKCCPRMCFKNYCKDCPLPSFDLAILKAKREVLNKVFNNLPTTDMFDNFLDQRRYAHDVIDDLDAQIKELE